MEQLNYLRADLLAGRYNSDYQAIVMRCCIFHFDMKYLLFKHVFPDVLLFQSCVETLVTAYRSVEEYESVVHDPEQKKRYARLAVSGFVQTVTQIVEITHLLAEMLSVDFDDIYYPSTNAKVFEDKAGMKGREWWRFRTRHTHIKTHRGRRSPQDPDGADFHVFLFDQTDGEHVRYMTFAGKGYMSRPISMRDVARGLQMDLMFVFEAIVKAAKALPELRRQ